MSGKTVRMTWGISLMVEGICVVILAVLNSLEVGLAETLTIPLCILIIISCVVMIASSVQILKRNRTQKN